MDYKEMIRALALGQGDTHKAAYNALSDADKAQYQDYMTAAFAIMIGVRFEEDSSRAEVDRFVNEVKSAYKSLGDQVKPLALEAVVRAALGEQQLINEVSESDQIGVQMLCIRLLTATQPQIADNLDAYLTDAETIAADLN